MSTSSLPALPAELIIQIFKSIDNFATATALSSTSRRFQSIWKTSSPSICYSIFARTIPCYHQAFEYVRAQPLNAASSEQTEDMDLLASKVTPQFYENAFTALMVQLYEADVIKRGVGGPSSMAEAQYTCFLQAWYRIHNLTSLANMARNRLLYDLLASLDLLQFEQVTEALRWLMHCCPNEHEFELRIKKIHPGVVDCPSRDSEGTTACMSSCMNQHG